MTNLALPGNPRYQPKGLVPIFGYDNLYRGLAAVEIANLKVLGEIGVMPVEDLALLTPEVELALMGITTTEVDKREREVTKHDVRAWVQLAQERVDPQLGRWIHVPLTSYDALGTGQILLFAQAFDEVTDPACRQVIFELIRQVQQHAEQVQIGRTHGQHALPITVGFWLATILDRFCECYQDLRRARYELVGKISGPVGASNAIVGLGIAERCVEFTYEELVLQLVDLEPAHVSTQIVPPDPLANFLIAAAKLSAVLGQFASDCRQLMRTEIGEIGEPFSADQVGSSTMAHKRNPMTFEGIEGAWLKNKNELGKVFDTLITEHQRDLRGSSVMRDFATIVVNLQTQLDTLLRKGDGGKPFIARISVDAESCTRNLAMSANVVLAEPMYIALQMAGYEGDGHHYVNHGLVPDAKLGKQSLMAVFERDAEENPGLAEVLKRIPEATRELLRHPEQYVGDSREKALAIAQRCIDVIDDGRWKPEVT